MVNKFGWTQRGKDAYMILFLLHKNGIGGELWEKLIDCLGKDLESIKWANEKKVSLLQGPEALSSLIGRRINVYIEKNKNNFEEKLKFYLEEPWSPINTSTIRYLFRERKEKCGANIYTLDIICKYIYGIEATFVDLFFRNWDDFKKYLHPSYREAYENVRKGIISTKGREAVSFADDFDCLYKRYNSSLFPFEQYSSSSDLSTDVGVSLPNTEKEPKEEEITGENSSVKEEGEEKTVDTEKTLASEEQPKKEESTEDDFSAEEKQEAGVTENISDKKSVDAKPVTQKKAEETAIDKTLDLSNDTEPPLTNEEKKHTRDDSLVEKIAVNKISVSSVNTEKPLTNEKQQPKKEENTEDDCSAGEKKEEGATENTSDKKSVDAKSITEEKAEETTIDKTLDSSTDAKTSLISEEQKPEKSENAESDTKAELFIDTKTRKANETSLLNNKQKLKRKEITSRVSNGKVFVYLFLPLLIVVAFIMHNKLYPASYTTYNNTEQTKTTEHKPIVTSTEQTKTTAAIKPKVIDKANSETFSKKKTQSKAESFFNKYRVQKGYNVFFYNGTIFFTPYPKSFLENHHSAVCLNNRKLFHTYCSEYNVNKFDVCKKTSTKQIMFYQMF